MRIWDEGTRIDPSFADFVRAQHERGRPVTIVSAGIETLIRRALMKIGLDDLPIVANDVTFDERGWVFNFRDDSPDGLYKERLVAAAREDGMRTVYIGDGISDFKAAREADRRFAKRGRSLEPYLRKLGLEFTPFTHFSEIRL
jgi:2-hydroxy-3-keto-5-methylthiopentenyl-1-phosphate phosphatase